MNKRYMILAAALLAAAAAKAGTSAGVSPVFTLDLQMTLTLTVRGRVLDAANSQPLAGVAVSLAGQNTTSGADGSFSLANGSIAADNALSASKAGYAQHTETVAAPPGAKEVAVSDILLATTAAPVVSKVAAKYEGIFLGGVPVRNSYTASVDWNGATPGKVQFFANEILLAEVTGSGPSYVCEADMLSAFQPSLRAGANTIKVVAVASGGASSQPVKRAVVLVPLPNATVQLLPGLSVYAEDGEIHAALDFDFPEPPVKSTVTLPVIGTFGLEIAANASFDYTVTDGDWEAALGVGAEGKQGKRGRRPNIPGLTRYPKLKLYVGNKEIAGELSGGARGTATVAQGITFDEVFGSGSINAKLELGRVGIPDLFGPGLSTELGKIPGLSDALKPVTVLIYLTPGIDGEVVYALQPQFSFKSAELTGKIGLEASYEPNLGLAKMRLYVGGEPSVTFQLPEPLLK